MIFNINPGGGGSGEPELLWTNNCPSAAFHAQTITLPTGYSAYLVEFKWYCEDSLNVRGILYVPFRNEEIFIQSYWSRYAPNLRKYRKINSASDGAINFGYDGDYDGEFMLPTRIWGVKWTI